MIQKEGFPYVHVMVTQTCTKGGSMPVNKVSMLRGVIARVLKAKVCHDFQLNCKSCKFENSCIYPRVFESPSQLVNVLDRGGSVPHPYIIRCHDTRNYLKEGDALSFEIIFIGKNSNQFAAYFYQVFENLPSQVFGKGKVTFRINEVNQLHGNNDRTLLYSEDLLVKPTMSYFLPEVKSYQKLMVRSITPFRFIKQKKLLHQFDLDTFLWQVNHRYKQLKILNFDTDVKDLMQNKLPQLKSDTCEVIEEKKTKNARYSNRQNQFVYLDGIQATVRLSRTKELDQWIPYLLFAEKFHVGKSTTFGMGQYELWLS